MALTVRTPTVAPTLATVAAAVARGAANQLACSDGYGQQTCGCRHVGVCERLIVGAEMLCVGVLLGVLCVVRAAPRAARDVCCGYQQTDT